VSLRAGALLRWAPLHLSGGFGLRFFACYSRQRLLPEPGFPLNGAFPGKTALLTSEEQHDWQSNFSRRINPGYQWRSTMLAESDASLFDLHSAVSNAGADRHEYLDSGLRRDSC